MILRCRIIRCVCGCVYVCVYMYVPCALVYGCHSSCAIALNKFDKRKKKKVTKKKKKIGKASRWAMNLGGKFLLLLSP